MLFSKAFLPFVELLFMRKALKLSASVTPFVIALVVQLLFYMWKKIMKEKNKVSDDVIHGTRDVSAHGARLEGKHFVIEAKEPGALLKQI